MRVLQIGYGNIGREVFADYSARIQNYMVVDLAQPVPKGHEWDHERVDVAVILVDTPRHPLHGWFDYTALTGVIQSYAAVADFLLIRSTVSLDFLRDPTYLHWADRIGFSPEFYGATKWSSREAVTIDFSVFTENVPTWFSDAASQTRTIVGTPEEVIVAKLTENAYLATKVTFFHELALLCEAEGIDFENVRSIVTMDPRIGPDHSFMEQYGWQSHCFDKDVPAFAGLGPEVTLVSHVIRANQALLSARNTTAIRSDATTQAV